MYKGDLVGRIHKLANTDFHEWENNKNHMMFYEFSLKIINSIINGRVSEIKGLCSEYTYLLLENNSDSNQYRFFKNQCIMLCTLSCFHAIQKNAPCNRMISLLKKFSFTQEEILVPEKIINHLINTLETFAYAVSNVSKNNYSLHVNRIMQYIKNHFTEKITLNQLAEYTQLSPIYISSLIKKETKLSLMSNINMIRIEESKNLLIYTNISAQEIAYSVGYTYQNHFNSTFKKLVGMTPLEFRRNYGNHNCTF